MNEQTFEFVRQVAIIIVGLAGGGAGTVWFTNRIKTWLGLSGGAALVTAAIMAVIVTLAGLIVEGVLTPGAITVENLSELFLMVFFGSQVIYRELTKDDDAPAHHNEAIR